MTSGYAPHPYPQAPETVGPSRRGLPLDSQPTDSKLDYVIGLLTRHDEGFFKNDVQRASAASGLNAGARVFDNVAFSGDLQARTLIVDNPGGYVLQVDGLGRQIPSGVYGYVVPCRPALRQLTLSVVSGTSAAAYNVTAFATEHVFAPIPIAPPGAPGASQAVTAADGALVTVGTTTDPSTASTLVGLLKNLKAALAGTLTVAIAAGTALIGAVKITDVAGVNQLGIDAGNRALVTIGSPATATNGYVNVGEKGTNTVGTLQQTSTASAATLLAARATRKRATIRNLDAANSVWLGPATVTTANGVLLKAGESRDYFGLALLQIIDNGAHASVDVIDYYD